MRKIFMLVAGAFFALAAAHPAYSGESRGCVDETCKVLHRGHVRGRIPVACVSIPFVKGQYGEVAMYVMRDFNPHDTPEGLKEQLTRALFKDSKITVRVDDFCRNPTHFAGGKWVVLCDEHHLGWITGGSLQYAIRHGRPPKNRRVLIGTHVRASSYYEGAVKTAAPSNLSLKMRKRAGIDK